ncbi:MULTISPECIES: NAD-dependent epimerase/dehydratase family protein [unclassified Nocardioides]|uniref:NAD-dependent epimerase/dehydratase family protein n=1 Tax=unclassified Nocardioides TaxID=2615069 RepID=UPI0006F3A3F6|nr:MULTISPECIES: NAD-dependent epimerase/dehydratase family protein [unclassified Nocardioides]KRA39194.1 diaminohydroxyphosphoribosylaminopyrimidine deaminase [Nocardioides sp. Root614]KRA93153.1 diaminohydroxyphosphoribosylaminopyrimidine deaminase [Nocardioides sp. Root682]
MTQIDPTAPVLVTGGSGYVASWIVRQLLEDGRTVRATVRNPQKPKGLEHLHALSEAHPGRLTLHQADLLDEGSFTAAMDGVELVIHTASPFLLGKVKDPQAQLVDPALEGTRNVLASVNATDSVKRVVLTSSVVALHGDNCDVVGRPVTEADWNTTSSLEHQPYPYSKTVAEKDAWSIAEAQERWDLVTIHPGLVLGPALTTSSVSGSMDTMKHFTDYSLTLGVPKLYLGVVDVRDVARAHIAAGFTPEAKGRYVTNADSISMLGIGRVLAKTFGNKLTFPRMIAPKAAVKLSAPLAGLTREFVEKNVGHPLAYDSSRTTAELGIDFRPVADTITEHYQQMIDDGLAKA